MQIKQIKWTSMSVLRRTAFALALPALLLAACDESPMQEAESYLKNAEEHYEKGDFRAAVIELKNALQIDRQNAEARLLLGKLYLDLRQGPNAEKELQRAQEFGKAEPSTALLLARAHLLQREFKEALQVLPQELPGDAELDGAILAARGQGHLGLGDLDKAERAFEEALQLRPDAVAYEGLARKALLVGDHEAAGRYIQAGLSVDDRSASLLALDGERLFRQRDFEEAAARFLTVLEMSPGYALVRLRLARTYVEQQEYEDAEVHLNKLLEQMPGSLDAKLLLGAIAFERRDYEEALRQASVVLSTNDGNLTALHIAGASSLALNQLEKAQSYLTRLTLAAPRSEAARRLLATTQMRLGSSGAALASLTRDNAVLDDTQDLRLLTGAALQSGNLQTGLRYLENLAAQSTNNADLRLQMGLLKIAMGQLEDGAHDLQTAQNLNPEIENDPSYNQAETLLIETYLRTGQLDKALEEAERLQQSRPESPQGFLYAGVALMAMNQPGAGEAAFLNALRAVPGYPPASLGLSAFEARRGNFNKAQEYLDQSLAHFPNNLQVQLRQAGLAERQGREDELKRWLERAISTNPQAIEPRISLNRFLMSKKQFDAALAIVAPLLPANESNLIVLKYVGQSQAFAGKHQQAIDTFKKWVELTPNSPQPYLALADVYEMSGDIAPLRQALEKAVALDTKNVPVLTRLGRLQVGTKDVSGARETIAQLTNAAPDAAEVKELEAGVALLEGNPQQAAELFQQARQVSDSTRLVMGQAAAEWEAQNSQAAVATLEAWIKSNPEDVSARFAVNRYYRELGEADKSQANLEAILTFQPQNWVAHNNLAELMAAEGQTTAALEHAETAYRLAPDNAGVMDTLGVILHKQGDSERAIPLLRQAAQRLPDVPDVGFHLAQVLADTGKTAEARQLLDQVLASEHTFASRAEAEELHRKLQE